MSAFYGNGMALRPYEADILNAWNPNALAIRLGCVDRVPTSAFSPSPRWLFCLD